MNRKIIIITILGVILFLLGMTYNNWISTGGIISEEIIEISDNSNEDVGKQTIVKKETPEIIEDNKETFIEEEIKTLECVVIIKENGKYNPLKLINYAEIENIGSVNSIGIGGHDYLKNRWGSASGLRHIYDGIQCIKDNGWILTSYESDGIFIKEKGGRLYLSSESFIEENGYFTRADNMKVTCCRIN